MAISIWRTKGSVRGLSGALLRRVRPVRTWNLSRRNLAAFVAGYQRAVQHAPSADLGLPKALAPFTIPDLQTG